MSKPKPVHLTPTFVAHLIEKRLVGYYPENNSAEWFGEIVGFSPACERCWRILWENFIQGNLPLHHSRIMRGHSTHMRHLADIFKRHSAWKRIIVGNGRGMYWLNVPEQFLQAEALRPFFAGLPTAPTTEGDRHGESSPC